MSPQKNKLISILLFLMLILISQILLPWLSPGQDFLFFTKWNMFSNSQAYRAFDIRFNGNTYLFRDERDAAKKVMNIHTLFFLVNFGSNDRIRKLYKKDLLDFCHCNKIERIRFQGNMYQHLLLKQDLVTDEVTEI